MSELRDPALVEVPAPSGGGQPVSRARTSPGLPSSACSSCFRSLKFLLEFSFSVQSINTLIRLLKVLKQYILLWLPQKRKRKKFRTLLVSATQTVRVIVSTLFSSLCVYLDIRVSKYIVAKLDLKYNFVLF